jgi:cytoskeletal protein CcmA (bactofilin family)
MEFRRKLRSLVKRLLGMISRNVEHLPSGSSHHSVIAPDLVITGSLRSQGDVYLLGTIQGSVECRRIFVEPGGVLDGPICTTDKTQISESP